jgi:hypothetical protein
LPSGPRLDHFHDLCSERPAIGWRRRSIRVSY